VAQRQQGSSFGEQPVENAAEAAQDINVDNAQLAEQAMPAPPKARSPLGNDSPIERAEGQGHLRKGQSQHLRSFGIAQPGMSKEEGKRHEAMALRDMDRFGEYDGMDDPNSPPPPIRPGQNSFNPMTAQWVEPEGQVSILSRFGGLGQPQGPNLAQQQQRQSQAMQGFAAPTQPVAEGPPGQSTGPVGPPERRA
jgi:hypothetical protein